jgi:hypothetical protein
MMLHCDVHGEALGVLVSPDIRLSMRTGTLPPAERLVFTMAGEEAMWFLLSKRFLFDFRVTQSRETPLPDSYPPWVNSLEMACIACLHSIDPSLPVE